MAGTSASKANGQVDATSDLGLSDLGKTNHKARVHARYWKFAIGVL